MRLKLFYFVICLILLNCKDPKPELTYQFTDQPAVINCNLDYSNLLNEALHNFEANLLKNSTDPNPNLNNAYRKFIKQTERHQVKFNNIADQHSLDIFEELKNIEGLMINENNTLRLNYNHEIFRCIIDNMTDEDIKTTFNALLSTNSMSFRMVKDLLYTKSYRLVKDKHLSLFAALELYYSKLANVDLTKKQATKAQPKPDAEVDPHAGHNHD